MTKERIYPTRSFDALDTKVQSRAIKAGQAAFVRAYVRFQGLEADKVIDDADTTWHLAMKTVDRTYGDCKCGNAGTVCPSYDEHRLVAWFIDEMEAAGNTAADLDIRLHIGTIDMFTASVKDRIYGIV